MSRYLETAVGSKNGAQGAFVVPPLLAHNGKLSDVRMSFKTADGDFYTANMIAPIL